jgi:hypothetical protein
MSYTTSALEEGNCAFVGVDVARIWAGCSALRSCEVSGARTRRGCTVDPSFDSVGNLVNYKIRTRHGNPIRMMLKISGLNP